MHVINANGLHLPVLGQGGWYIGDDKGTEQQEIAALRHGITLGMYLIDTAEMYGDGRSETLIGKAIKAFRREEYMLSSKVYPHNAGGARLIKSCEASLKRLDTDYLDLYLLHWPGSIPLSETVMGMESLVRAGKIKRWGVSNFDVSDMEALLRVPGGEKCAVDQVLYHIGSRGIEFDLIPWLSQRDIAVMAYCPLAQGGTLRRTSGDMMRNPVLNEVAAKYGITAMQLMLAFTIRRDGVMAIPKSTSVQHIEQNAAAELLTVDAEDWALLDHVFLPPTAKMHLDIE